VSIRSDLLKRIYEVYGEPEECNIGCVKLDPEKHCYLAVQRNTNTDEVWYSSGDYYNDLLDDISADDAGVGYPPYWTAPVVFDLEDGSVTTTHMKYVSSHRSRDALAVLDDGPIL
jgi:hypothetical protein